MVDPTMYPDKSTEFELTRQARELEEVVAATIEFAAVIAAIRSDVHQSLTAEDQTIACDLQQLTTTAGTEEDCQTFSRLPAVAVRKSGEENLTSAISRANALTQLVSKYSGSQAPDPSLRYSRFQCVHVG